jgi:hypothetical protein
MRDIKSQLRNRDFINKHKQLMVFLSQKNTRGGTLGAQSHAVPDSSATL